MKLATTLLSIALFGLAACSEHGRPGIEQAKIDFQKLYPEVEIMEVRNSENEVIAKSFEFTYRKKGKSERKKIEIQYMEGDAGPYKIAPAPPKELP
ncbi:hypothetical protein BH11VER1_BH11VER1_31120 [soil metagenome]